MEELRDTAQAEAIRENPMGSEKEGKLLFRLSVPIVVSMLIQALYNVVDSIFVSRISENALTGVSLAYPIQMLMISVAVGTGVGINSLISRRLGAGRHHEAELAATNGLFLMMLSSVAFILFGLVGTRAFFSAYTKDAEIFEMGVTYLRTCCLLCPGIFFSISAERIMQAQGKAMFVMFIQLVGAVTNLIFDPILIFGLLGFPKMGVLGAAIATVMGQWFSMILGVVVLVSKNNQVRLHVRDFKPHREVIGDIYAVGVPSVIMQSISTVMNLMMNAILIGFTATAVAVFGIYFKIQSVIFMPVFGVTGAAMSIMAFNFGARKRDRLMRTYRITTFSTMAIMAVGTLAFLIMPEQILALFDASPDMQRIGVTALRILGIPFPIAAYCIANSTLFQAVGNGVYSMVVSFMRQMIALVPAAWILGRLTGSLDAVWWSFPIAEIMSLLVSTILLSKLYQNRIKPMSDPIFNG